MLCSKKNYFKMGNNLNWTAEQIAKANTFKGMFSQVVEAHAVKPNRKVKNATKTTVDGIVFDSKLESYLYTLLRGSGLKLERQKVYVLQQKFCFGKTAIRAITLTVDFWLPEKNMIIDTKGFANDRSPLKYKMLKWYFYQLGPDNLPKIEMPKDREACQLLINRLLYDK